MKITKRVHSELARNRRIALIAQGSFSARRVTKSGALSKVPVTKTFATREEAQAECERMMALNPGSSYAVATE